MASGTDGRTDYEQHHLRPGTLLNNGQYKIVRSIGEGGFGITYEAVDNLDRQVAIKECFPSLTAHRSRGTSVRPTSAKKEEDFNTALRNFLREAQVLAKITHPNVVRVQTFFEQNDTAYMAMDYIHGKNLDDIIVSDPQKLTPNYVFRICYDLLTALDYLHENRILHRDIKPSNIRIDRWGTPILIDFGTAKQITSNETAQRTTREIVSDGYSPLEFYERGEKQGEASDLYSLAATLHHLVTGTVPPPAQQRAKRVWEGTGDAYTPLAGRFLMHERAMLNLIDRGMSLDIKERPVDAKAWLRTLPDMDTVSYHPEGPDAQKKPRRRWPDMAMGVMGGVVAAGLALFVLLQGQFLQAAPTGGEVASGLSDARIALDLRDAEIAELQDEIEGLQTDLTNARLEERRLTDLRAAISSERDDALTRIAELEEQLRSTRLQPTPRPDAAELQAVEAELQAAETRVRELTTQLSASQIQLDEAGARAATTAAQVVQLQSHLQDARNALVDAIADRDEVETDLADAERRLEETESLLLDAFGRVPTAAELSGLLGDTPSSTSLLDVASTQRAFLQFVGAGGAGDRAQELPGFLDRQDARGYLNAVLALNGTSVENDTYTAVAEDLQRLLQQERCGIEEVDGVFGVGSEAAYRAFLDSAGAACGPMPVLPRILSSDPVYTEWLDAGIQARDQMRSCDLVRQRSACTFPGPGRDCAREGGCLRGGVFSLTESNFCGRYNEISADDWDDLFMFEDSPGSIYVALETYLDGISNAEANARFARLQRNLPTLPLSLGEAVGDDGSRVYVAQLARGLSSVNLAHELVLYANFCRRPGIAGTIAPGLDAFAIRRGDGIMHISERIIRAIGLDPDVVLDRQ